MASTSTGFPARSRKTPHQEGAGEEWREGIRTNTMTRKKARASGQDQESIERHYTRVDFEDHGGASVVQRFRIELRKKVRVGRLVKVLSIFRHATEGTANSHGFFEGGTESAAPFEGSTTRKIAMKIPGASRSIGRGGSENLRATCRREISHCRVPRR